jgi:hypothetical protein
MTDPLARIEAMIETLGSREARFWTPLDTSQEQVSNPKPLENCGFGQFGQFGHSTGNTIDDDLLGEHENAPDGDAKTPEVSRASSLIQGTVQTVQTVQNHQINGKDQGFGFGHLEAASVQNRGSGVQNPASERLKRQHASTVLAPEGTPTEWIEGVALLRDAPAARGYPQHAWEQLILDAERFLDGWGTQAASLGWADWELFGCHRRAPWGRIQGMGLILLLRGDPLAALTASEAVIRRASGAHQTWLRKAADPLLAAERCLVWELA